MKLQAQDIAVHFGALRAVDGVSLQLDPGSVTLLAGPNGAGKSTLLGVLLGLVQPHAGQLIADGKPLRTGHFGLPRSFRAHLGYLPESVAFSENLTGRQVLRFFARARGVSRGRVEASLGWAGLEAAAGRPVRGYSRGMKQRLGLAVARLHEPQFLVLDEPTGGLDQEGIGLLWGLLEEWKAASRTVVMSSHDLALLERRVDRVVVMRQGRVLAEGSPDSLRRGVALPVRLRMDFGHEAQARSFADRVGGNAQGLRVELSVAQSELFGVLRQVNGEAEDLSWMRVDEPGLDEVYEHLLEQAREGTWDASLAH